MNQISYVQKVRNEYTERQTTKFDELKELNKKAILPAKVGAYVFGSASALILGTGMSFAMKVIGAGLSFAMPLGIGVGLLGIGLCIVNYFIYKKVLAKRKDKYSKKILSLTDELLNKEDKGE